MKKYSLVFLGMFVCFCAFSQTPNFSQVGFSTQNGGTKGGQGGATVTATNFTQLKTYAESATTYIIMIQGTISNGAEGGNIRVGSNKSLIGVGSTAFLNGVGLDISSKSNIIIQNLKISLTGITTRTEKAGVYTKCGDDCTPNILVNGGDCIGISGSSKNIWIDHCELFSEDPTKQTNINLYDGLIDIKGQSGFITISWCYLHDHHKTCLVGASDDDIYADRKVTYHHNYFKNVMKRTPEFRGATGHVFNNYIKGTSKTEATFCLVNCCLRIEKNEYETVKFMIYTTTTSNKGYAERIDNIGTQSRSYPGSCTASIPYDYSKVLTTNTADVKGIVMQYTGVGKITTTPDNTPPTVSITSPANNATYTSPAAITLNATAADANGTVSKVEFYNGTTLLGSDASSPYSYAWSNVAAGTYTITAVATDNGGAKTTSAAVTLVVKAPPKKYIYTYDNSGNLSWTNTNSWSPKVVPTAIDTVIIRSGEAQITGLTHTAPVYVEAGGTLRLVNGNSAVNDIHLQGGTLRLYTSSSGFTLTSAITVEKPSTIQSGSVATTVFTLAGSIKGTSTLTKTGIGVLEVTSAATNFTGNWNVTEGTLRIKSADALGKCGITVSSGATLDVATTASVSIYSVVLNANGKLTLGQSLSADLAVFGTENIISGSYTAGSRADYITGTGTLTVKNSILTAPANASLCAGAVQLGTLSSSNYIWKNGTAQVGTAQTYSATSSGDYTVSLTNANGCKVTSAAKTLTQAASTAATISTSTPTNFCTGGSVVLTASAGTSYKWLNGTAQVGTAQTYTATASGDYTVEVTNAGGCKATSAKTTVTVNVLPTAAITTAATSICSGSSVVLTASSGASYKWLNGTAEVGIAQTYTATTAGDYTVEVSNAAGCKAVSAKTTITVNAATAAISAGGSTALCSGESVTLTANAGTGYKWFNGTTQAGTSQSYTAAAAGDYTVEVTNANGCKATSAKTAVTLNTSSTGGAVTTSGSTILCEGESVVLSFSSGASYKWFNGTAQIAATPTYTASTAGDYSVEVTSASGCKVTSAKVAVTVNTKPLASISSTGAAAFCDGQSVVLTSSAGASYKWFNGTAQVGSAQSYAASTAGDYTVEVTNAGGCKATSAKTTVVVHELPTATITATTPTAFCKGGSVVLTASAGTSYKWFNGTASVGTNQTYTATAAGNYTVEVTNANGCKAISASTAVTVSSVPTATIAVSGSAALCSGSAVTLTASAGVSYKWFNGAAEVGSGQTYTASTAGDYTVEVTTAGGCKTTSAKTTITGSNATPAKITIAGASAILCNGGSKVLTANNGANYKWFNGNMLVGTAQNYTATEEGDYAVEVTAANGCVSTSSIVTLESGLSSVPVISVTDATTFCEGESVVLTSSADQAYKWFKGTIEVGSLQNFEATESGAYTVEITSASGCKETSAAVVVTAYPAPQVTVTTSSAAEICPGKTVVLTASAGQSYEWYNNGDEVAGIGQALTVTAEGAYAVQVTNEQGCIAMSPEVIITESADCIATSVVESQDMKLNVFPNPFAGEVQINKSGPFTYQLYDSKGALIVSGEASDKVILGNNLSRGLYLLRIDNSTSSNTIHLVKE